MIPEEGISFYLGFAFPRMSGDDPSHRLTRPASGSFSPHERG